MAVQSGSTIDSMNAEPLISVIIPALNEAETLRATMNSIRAGAFPAEIILVDAGSTDDTVALAEAGGARILSSSRRQRSHQMNLGARAARTATLLFLHADTLLPPEALPFIKRALRNNRVAGGAFTRRYNSPSTLLRATCALAHFRNRLIGWHLGDQAMFVRRLAFFQLGGFRDVDRFEDLDFSRRLKQYGRIVTLSPSVVSSARRFERGAARTTLQDLRLTADYLLHGLASQPDRAANENVVIVSRSKRAVVAGAQL